jgi:DNA gyrase/topoisomerase IV subunit A
MIKKSFLSEYLESKRNSGIAAIKLKEDDSVASVIFQDEEEIIVISKNGMGIRFATKEIGAVGRVSMGVKAINLNEGDEVLTALPIHKSSDYLALFSSDGYGKKMSLSEFTTQARGGKGVIVHKCQNGVTIAGCAMVDDEDNILVCGNKGSLCFSAKEIPVLSRTGLGNIIIKDSKIVSIAKI